MIVQIIHSTLNVEYDNDSSVEIPSEWESLFSVSENTNEGATLNIASFSLEELTENEIENLLECYDFKISYTIFALIQDYGLADISTDDG